MAQTPRLRRLAKEDFPEAPEWWGRFLDTVNPFFGDVTEGMSQQLDRQNLSVQTEKVRVETGKNPSDYFTTRGGQKGLQIKNKLGRQIVEVRVSGVAVVGTPAYVPGTAVFPTLEGTWTNYQATDGNLEAPGYMQDATGRVHLFGLAEGGVIGAGPIFTLPAQFWPIKRHVFSIVSNNAFGRCDVLANGQVIPFLGSTVWFALDGISFMPWTTVDPVVTAPYTAGAVPYRLYNPLAPAAWENTQSGTVLIRNIAGLAPNTKYDITLTLE